MLKRFAATGIGLGLILLWKPVPFQEIIAQISNVEGAVAELAQNQIASQEEDVSTPFRGVTYIHRTDTVPRRLSLHIVKLDLSDPAIQFELTPPNGNKPGDTQLETTLQYVQRVGAQVAINAGFAGDKISHRGQKHTDIISLAVNQGEMYSPWQNPFLFGINLSQANQVTFLRGDPKAGTTEPPIPLYNAIAGGPLLVEDGMVCA